VLAHGAAPLLGDPIENGESAAEYARPAGIAQMSEAQGVLIEVSEHGLDLAVRIARHQGFDLTVVHVGERRVGGPDQGRAPEIEEAI
jgi:hypothetical protein